MSIFTTPSQDDMDYRMTLRFQFLIKTLPKIKNCWLLTQDDKIYWGFRNSQNWFDEHWSKAKINIGETDRLIYVMT